MRKVVPPSPELSSSISSSGSTSAASGLDIPGESASERPFSLSAVRKRFADKRATRVIVVLALLLTSTGLTLGRTGDDYLHQLMLQDQSGIEGVWHTDINLFSFASGDATQRQQLMNEGMCPWWAAENLKFSLFRPLSALTHNLDYKLWPTHPVLMHLHSMLWFALLLMGVGAVHRRFSSSPWVAGFALFLYAVDDARATPVGWISNRNALIATLPPLLALLAHDRWRKEGDRKAVWPAAALLALGLGAGEGAVQVLGYFAAYAVFLDTGTRRQRLLSLAPYAAVIVLWRIVYFAGGYGMRGSALYLDPISNPLGFLHEAMVRLPVLWLAQFALPWAEFWDLFPVVAPWLQTAQLVLAGVVMVITVLLLRPLYQRDPLIRFWALGTFLSTLPACAAPPNDRLLTASGVGGAMLIARFIAANLERDYPYARRTANAATAGLIAVHALFSPFALPLRTLAIDGLEVLMRRADKTIPSDPGVTQREVVLINPPVDPMPIYFAGFRQAQGIPRPHYLRWLALGVSEIVVSRLDDKTLNIHPTEGYLSNSSQWMLRDRSRPSRVGDTVELADSTFVVKSITNDQRPLDVQVRFAEPLESPHYQWLQWGRHEYVSFHVPAVGESVTIPAVDMRSALLGLGLGDS
jgi:hypothetical protein